MACNGIFATLQINVVCILKKAIVTNWIFCVLLLLYFHILSYNLCPRSKVTRFCMILEYHYPTAPGWASTSSLCKLISLGLEVTQRTFFEVTKNLRETFISYINCYIFHPKTLSGKGNIPEKEFWQVCFFQLRGTSFQIYSLSLSFLFKAFVISRWWIIARQIKGRLSEDE